MKKIAISQSNYIPWKGYFDLIAFVDEFVIYDDMQFTKRDWRNRNKIKTPKGAQWLTVPVKTKGKYLQKINQTEINGNAWQKKHWGNIIRSYSKSKFFKEISDELEAYYLKKEYTTITELNIDLIKLICNYLNIKTIIRNSKEFQLKGDRTEKLVDICEQLSADIYVSGPSAKSYINNYSFFRRKIEIIWFNYEDYPIYDQLWGDFVHQISILDLLFNCGPNSKNYLKHLI